MAVPVVIIGAGGFGRHVHATVTRLADSGDGPDLDFLGFLDDGRPDAAILDRLGARHLGPVSELGNMPSGTRYLLGIGNGRVRRRIDAVAGELGAEPLTLIDPDATVGNDIRLGPGTIVCAGARLMTNIATGRHVHINENCTIGHDTALDDYVTVFPLAAVAGNVTIGADSTVGTNAAIIQGLHVGREVFVGAGAAVIRDVPNGVTAVGVPARYLTGA